MAARSSGAIDRRRQFVLYLAVLPAYRTYTIRLLKQSMGPALDIYVAQAHLDPTVTTGIAPDLYTEVPITRLGRRAFLQTGSWIPAILADTTVVDLNPRSLTAWLLLVARRVLRKRTLTWGHVSPQAGADARTAPLRRSMRRLSSGTISYTYSDQIKARRELPRDPVWVAPNAIYPRHAIRPLASKSLRSSFLYVGRFEPAKKVELLVRGFARLPKGGYTLRLVLIGNGSESDALKALVHELGIEPLVDFPGWISEPAELEPFYADAICSVSPGFAGLGLTQSLGFGVPSVVARDEPHSPEIELASTGAVRWFASDDSEDLARALAFSISERSSLPLVSVSEHVASTYSAESMAAGLENALRNRNTEENND